MVEPSTVEELIVRARRLAGLTVGQLAQRFGYGLDPNAARTKGSVGELVERALGATASCKDVPDFEELGVELKTVPMDDGGRVRESTFVCSIDLQQADTEQWQSCRLWRKLQCVLWVPVQSAEVGPLPGRRLGIAQLWRPSEAQQSVVRADWTLLMGRIAVGGVDEVSAHLGEALQVRPKAANSSVRVAAPGPDGLKISANPRGFYLRARFVEHVLWSLTDPP